MVIVVVPRQRSKCLSVKLVLAQVEAPPFWTHERGDALQTLPVKTEDDCVAGRSGSARSSLQSEGAKVDAVQQGRPSEAPLPAPSWLGSFSAADFKLPPFKARKHPPLQP